MIPGSVHWPRHARGTGLVPIPALLLLLATALMTLGALQPVPALRVAIVLPLALLVPGYALVGAIFGFQERFDVVPTLALSALLSMCSYMALGLGLNTAAIRLSPVSMLAGIDTVIIVLVLTAILRVQLGIPAARSSATFDVAGPPHSLWNGARAGVVFAAIVSVVVIAVVATMSLWPQPAPVPFTQFYLTGRWSRTSSLVQAPPNRPLVVTVGVANRTHQSQTYRIVPALDNVQGWTDRAITLPPGRIWSGWVSGNVPAGGCAHQLRINLYMHGHQGVLAKLILWVHRAPSLPASCASGKASGTP